jgi:hypothetical protein
MSDVAPSNHAGGRGTHGEGKESATADDDREGMRRKISSNHGLEAKNPGFRYHSSLNLIVLLSTTSEKPKIRKNEIQYFIVQHFPFFRQKLSVVLNCTPRSEKSLREAAVEPPRARSMNE